MFNWFKSLTEILDKEPESYLAYLHGQKLDSLPHLIGEKPHYSGILLQHIKLIYRLYKIWQPFTKCSLKTPTSYLFFCGTKNQIDACSSTINALRAKGTSVNCISYKEIGNGLNGYHALKINNTDLIKTFFILFSRMPSLYRQLGQIHPRAISYWLAEFCLIYPHLVYFYRIMNDVKPTFVVTSNDHSVPNRCFLAIAEHLNIPTVYLQHASVSNLFPPLRVTYAFLDGQHALDIYRRCETNPSKASNSDLYTLPKIFLTGQKKAVVSKNKANKKTIGFALNALDDTETSIKVIKKLSSMGLDLVVRWHPAQSEIEAEAYRRLARNLNNVSISEPTKEPASIFISHLTHLISGNSSIHLEAALAGVSTIYYEVQPASHPDYYGYVKNGISIEAKNFREILSTINNPKQMNDSTISFLRYYSSTYKTDWQGNEGKLVCEILESIRQGKTPSMKPLFL